MIGYIDSSSDENGNAKVDKSSSESESSRHFQYQANIKDKHKNAKNATIPNQVMNQLDLGLGQATNCAEVNEKQMSQLEHCGWANYVARSDMIKPTKKRFLILLLFCLHSAINASQWIYLSSVTNIVSQYYRVDNMAINWTSMIYMLVYIPLVVPSSWLFERIGMRNSILLGSLGTSLGSLIKCFCCQPDRFGLLMFGQTIVAISQLFVLSVPPRLAAVWFPDNQVSLANACGVFGNQLGIALGFVVPQLVLGNQQSANESLEQTGQKTESALLSLFVGIAICSSIISVLIMFLFDQGPLKAPGLARLQQIMQENASAEAGVLPLVLEGSNSTSMGGTINTANSQFGLCQSAATLKSDNSGTLKGATQSNSFGRLLQDLLSDLNFVLLMASYGLNVGVFYAISTVLNQMLFPSWPNANTLVGRLGLLMIIAGMFGSVISGLMLDITRRYRLINSALYSLSLVSLALFALTNELHNLVALHISVLLLGYFMTGYLFIGYEMSNEITWPRPESVTAGLLNLSAQVFGIILTYAGSYIVENFGNLMANIFFIISLSFGLVITLMIRAQMKRQNAQASNM